MSSYLSKPREFTNYVPEVNAELYGQLLQKHESEYQQGVQKIDKTLDYVAGLPVSNPQERDYLQQKVDSITSELNRNVNIDWSDQSMQKMTGKHIAAISGDPNVQTAVYNASMLKRGFSGMSDDDDNSKGKNVINKQAFMDQYGDWYSNGKVGEKFSGSYVNYQDVLGDFDKSYKDKHPDTHIEVQQAGYSYDANGDLIRDPNTGQPVFSQQLAAKQWDEVTHKWKELSPAKVQSDFSYFIASNPQYQAQIALNAAYSYKGLAATDFAGMQGKILSKSLALNQRDLKDKEAVLAKMTPDDPDRGELEKAINLIKQDTIPGLQDKLSPESRFRNVLEWQSNPQAMNEARKSLYMQDLYNGVVSRHAYKEDDAITMQGSPIEKQHWDADHQLKLDANKMAHERLDIMRQREIDRAAAAEEKQKALYHPDGISEEGITTAGIKTDWENLNSQYTNMRATGLKSKTNYIYNQWGALFPEKFSFDESGAPVIIDKYTNELYDLYDKRKDDYLKGNTADMSKLDIMHFQDVAKNDKLSTLIKTKQDEATKVWDIKQRELVQNIPAYQQYQKEASSYRGSVPAERVSRAQDAALAINKAVNTATNAQESQQAAEQIARNNGFASYADLQKTQLAINSDPQARSIAHSYGNAIVTLSDQKDKFFNDYVKANNFLPNRQFIPIVNPKNGKTDEAVTTKITKYLRGVSSPLLGKKEATSIGYVQEPLTGDYTIIIKGSKGEKDEPYSITKMEAQSLGLQDVQTQDQLSQILRLNTNRGGTGSTTWTGGAPSFEQALPLVDNGQQDIRYQVSKANGLYSVQFWAKDHNNSNDKGHMARDPKTGKLWEAVTNSLTDVRRVIDNVTKGGTPDVPRGYYPVASNNENNELNDNSDE